MKDVASTVISPIGMGVAAVGGGIYYYTGEIRKSYPVSLYHLYEVTLYSFKEEGTKLVSTENSKIDAEIIGETYDGKSIKDRKSVV